MKFSAPFPLSRIKVSLPRRREHLITRPRLIHLLNQFLDKKLILLSAPAGYGKTSLLVDFASQCELPVCWLALDELDRDPQRFVAYLIAALSERFPSFGVESMAALNSLVSLEGELESLVVTLTNELYDKIREHFILMLDDYHLVEDVETIRGFISRFVKLSDENCHLVLSSRRLTHLPDLPRMIADEQVEGLDFGELAFRPEEIRSLFLQNYHKEITEEAARELAEQSEGWITGLQLAGLSGKVTDHFRVAHSTGLNLNQYFEEQTLARQPAEIRSILLYTSLFDEFDADLCRSVLSDLFSEPISWPALLGYILENNLFVLPVGADGRWLRYHHLFRDFLRACLHREHPEQIHAIQSRLIAFYESRGEWERAYHVCRQFHDPDLLAELIEHAGPAMLRRAVVTLADWLNALPPPLANSRPGLLSLRGGIGYLRGNYQEALSLLNQAESIYRARMETPGLVLTLVRRAMAHFNLGEYTDSLRDAEEALQRTQYEANLQSDHAEAQRLKGLVMLRLGRTRQAVECFERSLALYVHLNETDSIPILLLNCGMAYRALGNYEAAEKSYQQALEYWRNQGNLAWQANALNNLGVLYHINLGEYQKASLSFNEGLTCANRCRYLQTEAVIAIGMGELYAELGEYEGARQYYEQAEKIAREIEDRFLLNYLPLAQAALFLMQNDTDRARQTLEESLPSIQAGNSQYELGLWSLRRGWLSLVNHEIEEAVGFLNTAQTLFLEDGRELETQWSRIWLAAAFAVAGRIAEARTTFKDALGGGFSIPHTLVAAVRLARPWLKALRADPVIGTLAAPLFQRAERLEAGMPALRRELRRTPQVVALSAPRLSIRSLGWTKVMVNSHVVEWPTQAVRELFFFFLTSQKSLRKDQVAEALWPDIEDPERIKQRFKNELYRLRRVVGPDIILLEGDHYHFNRFLDYDHDLEDFESYLARARSAKTDAERIEYYEKAADLVKGPYLADIGAAWAILDRERIHRTFLEVLISLAELHQKYKNPEKMLEVCQRILELDPAHEAAHQLAMQAHAARGDRAAVVRQYQMCREETRRLFNLPPSEETEKLYRRLIG